MALTRRKWNNIIIFASIAMVAILTFLDRQRQTIPDDAQPLFDQQAPLAQLQYDDLWLAEQGFGWQCDPQVLNCRQWAEAWGGILVSPIAKPTDLSTQAHELVLQIRDIETPQLWLFYPGEGLLSSPAGNWYQVPPSLRPQLAPILKLDNP
ncbi:MULTISPECIES: hypothetical protein [Shewanella]|uniref:hypothetical protein n=1 Tax=Shewanella TaxID=22 RepID=UPI001EFCDED0|nr:MULTISPECIES: hypothetical protein [Shewanella]MCG9748451.1 hypothetical protein [Shewanella sp. Isolate8]MCL2911271.1 hypothetical protein [Shewanella aquimarina]